MNRLDSLFMMFLLVGSTALCAADLYEPDDTPQSASVINNDGSPGPWAQDHEFEPGATEDWVALVRFDPIITFDVFEISIRDTSTLPQPRRINLQVFDQVRLAQPGTRPLDEFNDCNVSDAAADINNITVRLDASEIGLLRIRECQGLAGPYEITVNRQAGSGVELTVGLINGQTLLDGRPPGLPVLLLTTLNDATFSNASSADFKLAVLANTALDLNVVSDVYGASPIPVAGITAGDSINLIVPLILLDRVFLSGFE